MYNYCLDIHVFIYFLLIRNTSELLVSTSYCLVFLLYITYKHNLVKSLYQRVSRKIKTMSKKKKVKIYRTKKKQVSETQIIANLQSKYNTVSSNFLF